MGWMDNLLKGVGEGMLARERGYDWKAKLASQFLANAQKEQLIRETEETGPYRRNLLAAQAADEEAKAKGYLSREDRIAFESERNRLNYEIAKMRVDAANELNPEKRSLIEAQIKVLEHKANAPYSSGGRPRPYASPQGITYIFDPNTQTFTETDLPGGPRTAEERTKATDLDTAVAFGQELVNIFESNDPNLHVGYLTGGASKLGAKYGFGFSTWFKGTPFEASTEDVLTDATTRSAFMQRLYATTGKQINQTEWARLSEIMPDRAQPLVRARANARIFLQNMVAYRQRWNDLIYNMGMSEEQATKVIHSGMLTKPDGSPIIPSASGMAGGMVNRIYGAKRPQAGSTPGATSPDIKALADRLHGMAQEEDQ